ncbi:ATP/maltotriose-dependent transcriptional regulator MalT [Curtobacterium sp. PhB137]|uniref:helix-turn-helix transcriptional regulator n=1 Tax=Curtobacterium sp. PhB137 TaxID=2485182 RepID=UPI000F4DCF1F|nr:LuxR C-terminal-related transcriptional regulator [Curtobacterium sp. PhB137]RPE85210.1 ATP/maltotriose-dependent transcriptional regulator MalT [Curtobacterium sp. PhB137]
MSGVRRAPTPEIGRPRLVARIEAALRAGRPVVVSGPPSSGVTTLVREWTGSTTRAVAVGLRPDRPEADAVLVVDDAHLFGVDGIRALLDQASHVPVLLAGAAGPTLEQIADDTGAVVLGAGDLAFDATETATLLGRAVGVVVAPVVVARTVEGVGGLVGVLAAAAGAVAAEDRPPVDLGTRFHGAVDHATAAWIDTIDDPGLLTFSEHAAVVQSAPIAFLTELGVGPVDDPASAYRAAAAAGLGALGSAGSGSRAGAGSAFTWFDAVARALRAAGTIRHPERHREVVRRAAAWAITHDDTVTAVDAAVQLDDLDLLSDVLTTSWTRLTGPGAPAIARLLDPIRPRRAARHPVVLAAIARAESAADRHHARASRVNAAIVPSVAAAMGSAHPAEAVFLGAVESQARRITGDDAGARAVATTVRERLHALDATAADRLAPRLPFVLQQLAATALADGDVETALATLATIEPVDGPDGVLQRAAVDGLTALVHALAGEVDVARRLLAHDGALDLPTGTLASAVVALEDGDTDTVLALLHRVDPLFGAFEHWPIVLTLRARATTIAGRVPPADQLAAHDAEVLRYRLRSTAGGVGARLLGRARVRLQLAAGQLQHAERGLDALGPVRGWNAAEHMGVALARAEPERALEIVTAVAVLGGYEARTTALLVLLRAVALRRTGDVLGAVAAFREAIDLFDRYGMRGELLTPPRDDVLQLLEVAEDERARELFASIGRLRSVLPGPDVSVVLSERESVVLGLLAAPDSVPEIASELHVSVNTVKTQVRSVYRKLGVSTRREAVEQGRSLGLLA